MLGTCHAEYLVWEREGPSHVGVFTWKDLIGSVGLLWYKVTENILDIQIFYEGNDVEVEEIFHGDVEEGYEHEDVD